MLEGVSHNRPDTRWCNEDQSCDCNQVFVVVLWCCYSGSERSLIHVFGWKKRVSISLLSLQLQRCRVRCRCMQRSFSWYQSIFPVRIQHSVWNLPHRRVNVGTWQDKNLWSANIRQIIVVISCYKPTRSRAEMLLFNLIWRRLYETQQLFASDPCDRK